MADTRQIGDMLTTLAELRPNTKEWFAKVLVTEKWDVHVYHWGRHLRLLVVDEKNNTMQCSIYDPNIEKLDKRIQLHETYIIGNSEVKDLSIKVHRLVESPWHIILTLSSYIADVDKQEELSLDDAYKITPFAKFPQFADCSDKKIS